MSSNFSTNNTNNLNQNKAKTPNASENTSNFASANKSSLDSKPALSSFDSKPSTASTFDSSKTTTGASNMSGSSSFNTQQPSSTFGATGTMGSSNLSSAPSSNLGLNKNSQQQQQQPLSSTPSSSSATTWQSTNTMNTGMSPTFANADKERRSSTEQASSEQPTLLQKAGEALHKAGVAVGISEPTWKDKADQAKNEADKASTDLSYEAQRANEGTKSYTEAAKEAVHKVGVAIGLSDPTPKDRVEHAAQNIDTAAGNRNYEAQRTADDASAQANSTLGYIKEQAHKAAVAVGLSEPTAKDQAEQARYEADKAAGRTTASYADWVKEMANKAGDIAHKAGVAVGISEPTPTERAEQGIESAKKSANEMASSTSSSSTTTPAYTSSSTATTQQAKDTAREWKESAKDTAREWKESAKETAHKAAVATGISEPTAKDELDKAGESAKDTASDAAGAIKSTARDVKDTVRDKAHKAAVATGFADPTFKDAADDAKETAKHAGQAAKKGAKQARENINAQ